MISGGDYREAFFMFSATLRVPALTPDIPAKEAAAKAIQCFIWVP